MATVTAGGKAAQRLTLLYTVAIIPCYNRCAAFPPAEFATVAGQVCLH